MTYSSTIDSVLYIQTVVRDICEFLEFYGNLVYKLKKINNNNNNYSAQFIKISSHYKKIGYNINVLQQIACLVVNPILVGNFVFLFYYMSAGRTSISMMVPT